MDERIPGSPKLENGVKRKVLPSYSRADLPIHAKTGREWGGAPTNARSLYGRQDDAHSKLNLKLYMAKDRALHAKAGFCDFGRVVVLFISHLKDEI
jgi:hypothetical protein